MIKPVKCAKCGKEPEFSSGWIIKTRFIHEIICWGDKSGGFHSYTQGRTRIGIILRWNWRQWRARRKMKGEATT